MSIAYVTKSLVDRLYKAGFIYAEIRFAPQLHTRKGMSQEDAVIAALAGLKSALKDKKDFDDGCSRLDDYMECKCTGCCCRAVFRVGSIA